MVRMNFDGAKFLNKDKDIKHKDLVTIASEGGWEQSKNYPFKEDGVTPNNQFNIKLRLANGEERQTTLTVENLKLLTEAFGEESSDWIDKEVRAWRTSSDRAKDGWKFLYVHKDWNRNDMQQWEKPEGTSLKEEVDVVDYDEDVIDPSDIPFGDEEKPAKKKK